MTIRLFMLVALFLGSSQYIQAQDVSKGLYQVLEIEEENPTSLHIRLSTPNIEVKKTGGTKVRVSGKVTLSIPNLYFLEHLVTKGRYELALTPTKNGGMSLEDKKRTPIILRGEQCIEDVKFTIHIPKSVKRVVFENTTTGDSNVIVMK